MEEVRCSSEFELSLSTRTRNYLSEDRLHTVKSIFYAFTIQSFDIRQRVKTHSPILIVARCPTSYSIFHVHSTTARNDTNEKKHRQLAS